MSLFDDLINYELCFPGAVTGSTEINCPHRDELLTVAVNGWETPGRRSLFVEITHSSSPKPILKRLVLGPKLHRRRPQKSSKRINPGVLQKDSCGNNLRKRPAIQLTAGLHNSPH